MLEDSRDELDVLDSGRLPWAAAVPLLAVISLVIMAPFAVLIWRIFG